MQTEHPYINPYIIKYEEGDSSLERRLFLPSLGSKSTLYTVKEGDTIQSIAFRYYGDSGAWYKIADVNNIGNPFAELEVGSVLRVII